MAWWNRFKKVEELENRLVVLEANARVMNSIPTIKEFAVKLAAEKAEVKVKHAVQYGQGEVSYVDTAEEEKCVGCRFFSPV